MRTAGLRDRYEGPEYRVRFVYDEYPDLSYLQETEEDYLRDGLMLADTCEHCGIRVTNRGRITVHVPDGRIRCTRWRIPPHESIAHRFGGYIIATRRPIGWEEYRKGYGNPDNYVSLVALCEKRCPCCSSWETVDSLGGIDYYVNGPDLWPDIGEAYGPDDLDDLDPYAREVAKEMLDRKGDRY